MSPLPSGRSWITTGKAYTRTITFPSSTTSSTAICLNLNCPTSDLPRKPRFSSEGGRPAQLEHLVSYRITSLPTHISIPGSRTSSRTPWPLIPSMYRPGRIWNGCFSYRLLLKRRCGEFSKLIVCFRRSISSDTMLTTWLEYSLSYGVMHRLPRCSPDVPIQYKQWTIPVGVRSLLSFCWLRFSSLLEQVPVGMSAYLMHSDPTVYPKPFEFIPERWLGDVNPAMYRNFVPFCRGSRNCLGMK